MRMGLCMGGYLKNGIDGEILENFGIHFGTTRAALKLLERNILLRVQFLCQK